MLPMDIKLCCKILGTAILLIFPSIFQEKTSAFSSVCMEASLFFRVMSASTQAIPWARKVAQATPATPQ